jgi:hypothetical protein
MLVKLALTPPHFIEVPVPTHESELSCICVLEVTLYLFLRLFLLGIRNVSTVWYFFCFVFYFILNTQHSISMWHERVCDKPGLWVVRSLCVCGLVSVSMIFLLVLGVVLVVSTFFFIQIHIFIFFHYCLFTLWF